MSGVLTFIHWIFRVHFIFFLPIHVFTSFSFLNFFSFSCKFLFFAADEASSDKQLIRAKKNTQNNYRKENIFFIAQNKRLHSSESMFKVCV